jgi:hypothetical protein
VGAAVLPIAGAVVYAVLAPQLDVVAVGLGGNGQLRRGGLPPELRTALTWDLLLIASYGTALAMGILLAMVVARGARMRSLLRFALFAAGVTVVAGLSENLMLYLAAADRRWPESVHGVLLDVAASAAILKFSAALPAASAAVAGVALTAARLSRRGATRPLTRDEYRMPAPCEGDAAVPPAASATLGDATPGISTRWRNAYSVPDLGEPPTAAHPAVTGICLSGGGIRSACVALGVSQAMRRELRNARYLVSVSGGGYTAGGLQQAITAGDTEPVRCGGTVQRDPGSAFQQGTVTEDHLRRHASYLTDTAAQLLAALATMGWHLLLSVTTLFAPAVLLGAAAGWFYSAVPVTDLRPLLGVPERGGSVPFPQVRPAALALLALLVVVVLLTWLWSERAATGDRARWAPRRAAARAVATLAVVVAVVAVVVPAIGWVAAWILHRDGQLSGVAVGGPVVTVLLTYLAAVAAMVWRNRRRLSGLLQRGAGGAPAVVPTGLAQRALVLLTLAVLGAGWLLVVAGMVVTERTAAVWAAAGAAAALTLLLGGVVDQTTLSLHPFYRRRLASAFAVRAVRRAGDDEIVAVPYDPAERTTLSKYGTGAEEPFPEVLFAATANLTGQARTASGLNAVPYTFGASWVGGPDIGWVKTETLEKLVPARYRRDLTVQGAVALSGAAFASTMGRGARWFQALFTVTGARLGAWMPNPRYVGTWYGGDHWERPLLPSVRRLGYLLRELFNLHPYDDPLLYVTDGGHYENLGLVELFRRRCTRIYCLDATGDAPPTATTLAEAITLASEELGVRVKLTEPWTSEPGTGGPLGSEDPSGVLGARLSRTPLIVGTFSYPPESDVGEGVVGHLVVAKALLWRGLPDELLSYAAHHPEFPHDRTADQWMDDGQYTAYTELGRRLGCRAVAAMAHMPATGP